MTQPELIHQLYQRLATTSDETPYCIIPRSLLVTAINAIDHIPPATTDPLLSTIEKEATAKEFRLLMRLAEAWGSPVTHANLMAAASIDTLNSLQVHFSRLRAKLAENGWGQIVPVRHIGYAWIRPGIQISGENQ